MKPIVWLASYPKSGNTWTRIFLNNLIHGSDEAPDFNSVYGFSPIASDRSIFDNFVLLPSADMTVDEVQDLRPRVYEMLAQAAQETPYLKIHDARTDTPSGEPLVPAGATKAVVYIVRNPLDVAVSYAHHSGTTMEKMVTMLGDRGAFRRNERKLSGQLHQCLLDWSGHVESWIDSTDIAVHWMRYEDMLEAPFETFKAAVEFLGLEMSDDRIRWAVEQASFERLQRMEIADGFGEKPDKAKRFFRKGKAGSWREELNAREVENIVRSQGDMMTRLGYLPI